MIQNKYWKLLIITKKINNKKQKVLTRCSCWFFKKIKYWDILLWKSKSCWHCKQLRIRKWDIFWELKIISNKWNYSNCYCSCWRNKQILNTELYNNKHTTCWNYIHSFWENNPNWKWWVRDKSNNIRKSKLYKEWRNKCFERDNYTCQISWQKWWNLVIHHLTSFSIIISDLENDDLMWCELLWDINNWITITNELHIEFHKKYWTKNFTKDNFYNFMSCYSEQK